MKEETRYGPGNPEVNLEALRNSKLIKGMTKFLKEEEKAREIFKNPISYYLKYGPSEGHDFAVEVIIIDTISKAIRAAKLEGQELERKKNELKLKMAQSIEGHLCPDCRGKQFKFEGCVKCEIEKAKLEGARGAYEDAASIVETVEKNKWIQLQKTLKPDGTFKHTTLIEIASMIRSRMKGKV